MGGQKTGAMYGATEGFRVSFVCIVFRNIHISMIGKFVCGRLNTLAVGAVVPERMVSVFTAAASSCL